MENNTANLCRKFSHLKKKLFTAYYPPPRNTAECHLRRMLPVDIEKKISCAWKMMMMKEARIY